MSISRADLLRQQLEDIENADLISKKSLEEKFLEEFKESHVIDEKNGSVIFLYKADSAIKDSDKVYLFSELSDYFSGFDSENCRVELKRIKGTTIYSLTSDKSPIPNDHLTEYIYIKNPEEIDEKWENVRTVLSMPNAPKKNLLYAPTSKESATDQLNQMKKQERFLKFIIPEGMPYAGREFWVHLPKDYKESDDKEYPLLLLLDGNQFHTTVPMPYIMENMVNSNVIQPTVTVLIASAGSKKSRHKERFIEYDCDDKYTRFLATDFIKLLREGKLIEADSKKEYRLSNITDKAQHTTISGASAGGLAAVYAGLTEPHTFGNVIALSPAVWMQEQEGRTAKRKLLPAIDNFPKENKQGTHFYFSVGRNEKNRMKKDKNNPKNPEKCHSMVEMNDIVTDRMKFNRIHVDYKKYNGGHNDISWQNILCDRLKMIYPANVPKLCSAATISRKLGIPLSIPSSSPHTPHQQSNGTIEQKKFLEQKSKADHTNESEITANNPRPKRPK